MTTLCREVVQPRSSRHRTYRRGANVPMAPQPESTNQSVRSPSGRDAHRSARPCHQPASWATFAKYGRRTYMNGSALTFAQISAWVVAVVTRLLSRPTGFPARRRARNGWTNGTQERNLRPSGERQARDSRAAYRALTAHTLRRNARALLPHRVPDDGIGREAKPSAGPHRPSYEVEVPVVRERPIEAADPLEDLPAHEEVGGDCAPCPDCPLLIEEHVHVQEGPYRRAPRGQETHRTGSDIRAVQSYQPRRQPFRLGPAIGVGEARAGAADWATARLRAA